MKKYGKVMKNYTYNKLVDVERDSSGNINLVKTDIVKINEIISQITENIELNLEGQKNNYVYIKAGSLTGSKLLAGIGPKIGIKITSVGSVSSNVKSEFRSTGINQTLHRIYLEISCNISVLTPFETINENVDNQILLAESVIVGHVPDGYYNLEGNSEKDLINTIDK